MVDIQVCASFQDNGKSVGKVVDVHEGPGLRAVALNRKRYRAARMFGCECGRPQNELRNDVLAAHVRSVHVVRANDEDALKVPPAVVQGHEFADDLAAAVGEARIQGVRNGKGRGFVRGNARRGLVHFGAGGEDVFGHVVLQAGVDGVHDALHTHVEDDFRLAVEPLGAVHGCQVAKALHAPGGPLDGNGIPDVRIDEFHVVPYVLQASRTPPGLVVENPDPVAVVKQAPYQGGTDESGAARDQVELTHGSETPRYPRRACL